MKTKDINKNQNAGYLEALERIKKCRMAKRKELDLCNLNLEQIPSELSELIDITDLSLCKNNIKKLPSFIGKLKKLEELNISYNRISTLPKEITNLCKLTTLDISYNKFTELPEYLSELENLKNFEDTGNKLPIQPDNIIAISESKELDLLGHCRKIVDLKGDRSLDKLFFKLAHTHISFVATKLDLSVMQAVLFSHFLSFGETSFTIQEIAEEMHCSNLQILQHLSDFEEMEKRKLIRCKKQEYDETKYFIPPEVIESVRNGKKYELPSQKNISIIEVFAFLQSLFTQRDKKMLPFDTLVEELSFLINENSHLKFCKKINEYNLDKRDKVLLLFFCNAFINKGDDMIMRYQTDDVFDGYKDSTAIWATLMRGTNSLIKKELIENHSSDHILDDFSLTCKAKKELFSELKSDNQSREIGLTKYSTIKEKKLFYDEKEELQIKQLTAVLQNKNFKLVQKRLASNSMRTGFACLFSGPPGTGKTETAYQIARMTQRNIMLVDIAEMKSKWVGESEKIIKGLFEKYQDYVENSKLSPILLFNEADAIIGKRMKFNDDSRSVDQMENTLQNIILQEIENLNGIIIATTNLTENMDKAFQRRFLYKIEFSPPSLIIRKNIWQSIIPSLTSIETQELASRYKFSGGQIENIARKRTVDSVLSGVEPTLKKMFEYCDAELLDKEKVKIGFTV